MNKLICTLIVFTCSLSVFAQIDDNTFIHVTNKKIDLPEGNRNFEKITEQPSEMPGKPQEYQTEDVELAVPKLTTKIDIVRIKPPTLAKLYGNYVKAGFGNYTTPYLEAFLNNKRSENLAYGLHVKHFSSQNGPVKFSGLSQNGIDAYVRYFSKKNEIYSIISYNRERYNFYGFDHSITAEDDTLKQLFNTIAFHGGVKSLPSDSKLNYNFSFSYFNFSDHFKAKEDEYLPKLSLGYKIDSEKSIITDAVVSVSNKQDSLSLGRIYFQMRPAFVYTKDIFKITGGINLAYTNDTLISGVHLYPRIKGEFTAVENVLTFYAGMDGGLEKNTLRSFIAQTPYLQPNVPVYHSNKPVELFAGLRGNLTGLDYKAELNHMTYKNLFFFNNSVQDSSRFTALYDFGNTTVLNLKTELAYEVSDRFRTGLNLNYFKYNTGALEKPWHRPNFTASLIGTYNLHKKIYIETDIYYISGLMGKNYISGKEYKLDNIFDLNLKVDYRFSNVFSAFLEVNNILSQKYQRYLYYPVKGINVIGGITYSFAIN
ncbi:MAG: hypothetical protein K2X86_18175 [Cytophagaceae bacterium]|nr:hypothetical protein [Cytophagaceae bacterium]